MTTCASGRCGGHPRRQSPTKQIEFVVRSEDGDNGPFDSFTEALAYKDRHDGYVVARAKQVTP